MVACTERDREKKQQRQKRGETKTLRNGEQNHIDKDGERQRRSHRDAERRTQRFIETNRVTR